MKVYTAKIAKTGRITIPADLRREMKFAPGHRLVISLKNDRIIIRSE